MTRDFLNTLHVLSIDLTFDAALYNFLNRGTFVDACGRLIRNCQMKTGKLRIMS